MLTIEQKATNAETYKHIHRVRELINECVKDLLDRGMEATERGFRFFIRATRYSKLSARNEIRSNANVYMPIPEEGW